LGYKPVNKLDTHMELSAICTDVGLFGYANAHA